MLNMYSVSTEFVMIVEGINEIVSRSHQFTTNPCVSVPYQCVDLHGIDCIIFTQ